MAGEEFLIRVALDAQSVPASLLAIANGLASMKGEVEGLDPAINRLESQLVKMAGTTKVVTDAEKEQAAETLKLNELVYTLAEAYDRLGVAQTRSTAVSTTQVKEALYEQQLAFERTGAAVSIAEENQARATLVATTQIKEALYEQQLAIERVNAAYAVNTADKFAQNLSTTRYALFSAAQTLTQFGGALLLLGTLPGIVSAKFQADFAQVTRTVAGAGNDIKNQLIQMSETLPLSFKELSSIAALGGQLGISKSGIIDFTRTVAELHVTTNLTAEAAGTMLGRFKSLIGVPETEFKNLASSILNVGVNTVATESQIVAIATNIASVAKEAGFTAPQIIGLSGALASLGDQPYLTRGVITRAFTELTKSISEGGPQIQAFANIAGISFQKVHDDFGTKNFAGDFVKFAEGLGRVKISAGGVAGALLDVGLYGSNNIKLFQTLAQSGDLLRNALDLSNQGWNNASILTKQFNIVADTTSSKFKELVNSVEAFFNAIGSGQQTPLSNLIDLLKGAVVGITNFASTSAGQTFIAIASGAAVLIGALALLGALAAKATGGMIGLTQALAGFNAREEQSIGIMAAFNRELAATGGAGRVAAGGIDLVSGAMKLVIPAILIFMGLDWAGGILKTHDAALKASISVDKLKGSTSDAAKEINKFLTSSDLSGFGVDRSKAVKTSGPTGDHTYAAEDPVATLAKQVNNREGGLASVIDVGGIAGRLSGQTEALEATHKLDQAFASLVKGGNVQEAANLFKTLQDRAKAGGADVKDFSAQFTLFGAALRQNAADMKKSRESIDLVNSGLANQKDIVSTLKDLTGLGAKAQTDFTTAYLKSVAPLTDFNSIVKSVQDGMNPTKKPEILVNLDQFTKQLQENNGAQRQWSANLIQLSNEAGVGAANVFIAAGYSATSNSILEQLVKASGPQRDEYIKAQRDAARLASEATAQAILASGYITMQAGGAVGKETGKNLAGILATGVGISEAMATLGLKLRATPLQPVVDTGPAQNALNSLYSANNGRHISYIIDAKVGAGISASSLVAGRATGNIAFAGGGAVTGPGTSTSDSIPAALSNGEWVINAASVRQYGSGFFDSLNRGVARFASGGPVGTPPSSNGPADGANVVYLSAQDKAILTWIGNSLNLSIDGQSIAKATNGSNLVAVQQRQVG